MVDQAMDGLTLVPYQACRSTDGWFPVVVGASGGDASYTVFVSPWATHESICECKGYRFRGRCKHQEIAAARVCGWTELTGDRQQNVDERKNRVCPSCGGPTKWEVDVVED